jgi:RNA polymerase sigma-70 factor (ECF subfamily)
MTDEQFKTELLAVIPDLRAFAYSMVKRADADDLAQESLLKAWRARASYRPGTNFKGWIFTIQRNLYLSNMRRAWRSLPLDPEVAENTLVSNDDPFAAEELLDVRNAMQHLEVNQREALVLVGAAGLSYEETAKICGCAIGTVKSRVNRARGTLAAILKESIRAPRARTAVSSSQVFREIMQGAANLQLRVDSRQRADKS